MEYDSSGVEPSPALTRALKEIRLIQTKRLKTKMTNKVTIGDGEATMTNENFFKTYTGTITIVRIDDDFHVQLCSDGKRYMILPCEQIISCSMVKAMVTLQLQQDYVWEECILKFHSEEQAEVFKSKLPPIKRPGDHNPIESSDIDFDDSSSEKTELIKDNSFNSDNPLNSNKIC